MGITLRGLGYYVPEDVLTNFDLERIVDTSDEWIVTRTGIKERRIAKKESLLDMAEKASRMALDMAKVSPQDIDAIIIATTHARAWFPRFRLLAAGQT
jgi:3-oxoacyl-[acyl-carrier-protein] synthase III (EC 2.3.1.41)